MAVLPRSVSTSRQPARESVLAMRSAGKCGSMGKYAPPALKIASTAVIQSRLRSVTTPTTPSRVSPRASRARATWLALALTSPYVSCLEPCMVAMASGRPRAWSSKTSWARRAGSFLLGPARIVITRSLMSHLPRRVAAPPPAGRDMLAFHEEGVGGEDGSIIHRHAVVDERADADRAAGAQRGSAGLVRAVLLRIALDLASLTEHTFVPDGGQRRLGDVHAVVEHPPADANTDEPPEHALEWSAVEHVEEMDRMQLPNALDPPEAGVVDGADGRWRRADRFEATLDQRVVDRGDDGAESEQRRHERVGKDAVEELDRGEVDDRDQEDTQPPRDQENADGSQVELVLRGQAATQRLPRAQMVESAVALDGPRNPEGWRAQQAYAFTDFTVERNHRLDREQAVIARHAPRRVGNVVAKEVAGPDRHPRHPERAARDVVIDHVQPVGEHRSPTDG